MWIAIYHCHIFALEDLSWIVTIFEDRQPCENIVKKLITSLLLAVDAVFSPQGQRAIILAVQDLLKLSVCQKRWMDELDAVQASSSQNGEHVGDMREEVIFNATFAQHHDHDPCTRRWYQNLKTDVTG
jgi:hypothetical protein